MRSIHSGLKEYNLNHLYCAYLCLSKQTTNFFLSSVHTIFISRWNLCLQCLICVISVTTGLNLPKEVLEKKAVVKQLSLLPGTHDLESPAKTSYRKGNLPSGVLKQSHPIPLFLGSVWMLHLSLSGKMKGTLGIPVCFFLGSKLTQR